jgi:hypothetical protein
MEILSYKLLTEQPLNQANLNSLVKLNRARGANITRVSAANAYRNLIFSFVNRNVYNRYVNLNVIYPTRFVLATVNYNFLTIYENNACYFYPYINQDVVKLNQDEVRTYLKIELFDRTDPSKQINIKSYFDTFKRDPSRLNKDNVFVFKLTIEQKFDEINQKYGIKNQAVLKLPSIARRPNTYYVSFDGVSSQFKVDDRYDKKDDNKLTPKLQFNLVSQQAVGGQNYVTQLNSIFNGQNQFTIQELNTSSLQLTNVPQTQNGFYNDFKFYTIFTYGNVKVYLFTKDKFSTYFRQLNMDKDCYIYRNRNFLESKVKVISI